MSIELTPIEGEYEVSVGSDRLLVNHAPCEMQITSFSGGNLNGPSIQLSLEHAHIQLNKEQVQSLIRTLSEWLTEYHA